MFRSAYGERYRVTTEVGNVSMTKQSFKDETDINNILKKYLKTGILPLAQRVAEYGDYSDVGDYQSALNTVIGAQEAFMALPAKLRERFGNDPGQFLGFLSDPSNRKEAEELGLVEKLDQVQVPISPVTAPVLPPAQPVPPVTT